MWPFGKKTLNPDHLPIDGPWSVSDGEYNGKLMIVRFNGGYKQYRRIAGYDHQVGIAIPLRAAEPSGLPSPEEDMQLGEIEDAICASLEEHIESLFVAIITTNGMREFVFYTSSLPGVKRRFEQLRAGITTTHEIQLTLQPDEDWSVYAQLAG